LTLQRTLLEYSSDDRDAIRKLAARALGITSQYLPEDKLKPLLNDDLLQESASWLERDGHLIALTHTIRTSYKKLDSKLQTTIVEFVSTHLSDDNVTVKQTSVECAGELLKHLAEMKDEDVASEVLLKLAALSDDSVGAIRQASIEQINTFALLSSEITEKNLPPLVTAMLARKEDQNGPARRLSMQALASILQFHKGKDKAQELVEAYAKKIKKDSAKEAFLAYIKKLTTKGKTEDGAEAKKK